MKMEINIDNLSLFNLKKICRTCLAEGEMIPLYDTCIQKNCIIEMLMSCTFIQIDKSDGLPEQICTNCLKEVEQAYKFAQKCESVQQLLKNHLKNTEITNCKVEHQNKTKFKFKILKNHSEAIKEESNSTKPVMPKVKLKLTDNITNNVEEHTVNIKNEIPKVEITESQNLENNSIKNEYNIKTEELSEHVNTEKSIQSTECENSNEFNDISEEEINDNNDDDNWSEDSVLSLEKPIKLRKKRQIFLTKGPPYICQPCNITFENYAALQEHRKKLKHPKTRRKVSCSICQRELASSQLKQHMRTHTKERPYVCTYCGRGFSLHRNMKRHMMIHTGERPYKCQECDKAFIQYTSLKEHMNKHSGQTPFVCSVCGTTFKYNAMLRKHIRSKHPEQNGGQEDLFEHECPTCNRRYHTKQILRQHMLIHGEKTYLCSVCGKGFYNNAGLQTHIKVHTGHRPHACNICGKAFRQTSGLKMHVLIHTGEKPYACSICNKAFTQRNHLRYHMRTHTGEKPYSCTVCGKSFSTNGTLTVHKRTHTGETPYICSVCGKGFYDSSSMKKHKRGHGESEQIPQNN